MSIINCKTSQSKIYLTAKTAGEAEVDMGALSFQKMTDGFSSVNVYFCSGIQEQDFKRTVDGNLASVST